MEYSLNPSKCIKWKQIWNDMDLLQEKINNLCSLTIQKLGDPLVLSIVMPIADVMIFVVENPARVANEHRPSERRVILNKNFESLEGFR